MLKHFENMGIEKIYETTDSSRADFDKTFKEIKDECYKANDDKTGATKFWLYVYFAGHGAMYAGSTTT